MTYISLFLNHYFPQDFIFYRVAGLEDEIFQGFQFFSEIVPEFRFPFRGVGKTGVDRYSVLNKALLAFAKEYWPKVKEPQGRLGGFLYEGLGRLFLEHSDVPQYWLMATREENFEELDSGRNVEWSGRKEMDAGDLVFMYRTSPRSAITDVYEVVAEPRFDPWGGWGGFWVDLEKITTITDVTFAQMRSDAVLGQWGVVRQQFQGAMTVPMPPAVYNRLLERIPEAIRHKYGLEPAPVADSAYSGTFVSEEDFEQQVLEPLLKRWRFRYQRQYDCPFQLGSQPYQGRVDFYVSNNQGPLTLIEAKLRIVNEKELRRATAQAKSYALMLGLASFIVAAPEGLWIYSLKRNQEHLEKKLLLTEVQAHDEEIKSLLLRIRD